MSDTVSFNQAFGEIVIPVLRRQPWAVVTAPAKVLENDAWMLSAEFRLINDAGADLATALENPITLVAPGVVGVSATALTHIGGIQGKHTLGIPSATACGRLLFKVEDLRTEDMAKNPVDKGVVSMLSQLYAAHLAGSPQESGVAIIEKIAADRAAGADIVPCARLFDLFTLNLKGNIDSSDPAWETERVPVLNTVEQCRQYCQEVGNSFLGDISLPNRAIDLLSGVAMITAKMLWYQEDVRQCLTDAGFSLEEWRPLEIPVSGEKQAIPPPETSSSRKAPRPR